MTSSSALEAAIQAYNAKDFQSCETKCKEAIESSTTSELPGIRLLRACAFFCMGKMTRALSECSEVCGYGDNRLLSQANQLKGECFLKEEDFEAALESFNTALKNCKVPKTSEAIKAFIDETKAAINGSPLDNSKLESVTTSVSQLLLGDTPSKTVDSSVSARVAESLARPGPSVRAEDLAAANVPIAGNLELVAPSKYRMQFNQNAGVIEVQVFAKQLNKQRERVSVEIQESYLKVEIRDSKLDEVEYLLEEQLYQPIDVGGSKWDVWATQVNIKLKKGDAAIVWPSLSHSDVPPVPGGASIVDPSAGRADEYPTSHRKQPRDWGSIENDVKKEEADEKLDGDAGLQKFFQQLYSNADEDTRRAMNKSFQQSGGTSLSTNWKDVKDTQFDCSPPEGVKVKKFEQ